MHLYFIGLQVSVFCFHRKSWLVPTQYLLGFFMLYLSFTVNSLLQSEKGPNVVALTGVFFMLAFLAATQVVMMNERMQNSIQSVVQL